MSDVAQRIHHIIATYAIKTTPEQVAQAEHFQDLGLDSVGLLAILDDVEEAFGFKFEEEPSTDLNLAQFVALVEAQIQRAA